MYNTVKEMHIALDLGLQHIDSNRKQSIGEDHKDMALNYAVLQFIENRTNPKTNIKREGLEDTQKRYDDIKDLKKSTSLVTYSLSDNKVYAILPQDYYKLISIGAKIRFSKFDLPSPYIKSEIKGLVLPFKDDKITSGTTFNNITITRNKKVIFTAKDYVGLPPMYKNDAKFMLINLILEELNKIEDIDVYWERWNKNYRKDSFIIVTSKVEDSYNITYSNQSYDIKEELIVTSSKYQDDIGNRLVPVDLISSENEFEFQTSYHNTKNLHLNPKAVLEDDIIRAYEGEQFVIGNIDIVYYKKPRLISIRHNQSCELRVNREIIDLAVQRLKAYIKDEGYQHIVNESKIIE